MSGDAEGNVTGAGRLVPNGLDRIAHLEAAEDYESPMMDYLTDEFRMVPRDNEAAIIERIKDEVQKAIGNTLAFVDQSLERFYDSVRVYDLQDGQRVYRRHDDGRYVEDWSRLRSEAAEAAIWDLHRAIMELDAQATDAEMRMKYAYTVWDNEYQEGYRGLDLKGATVGDRTAEGRHQTKDERYYYLFSYWMWRSISDRVRVLQDTRRIIEFQVQRIARK